MDFQSFSKMVGTGRILRTAAAAYPAHCPTLTALLTAVLRRRTVDVADIIAEMDSEVCKDCMSQGPLLQAVLAEPRRFCS